MNLILNQRERKTKVDQSLEKNVDFDFGQKFVNGEYVIAFMQKFVVDIEPVQNLFFKIFV